MTRMRRVVLERKLEQARRFIAVTVAFRTSSTDIATSFDRRRETSALTAPSPDDALPSRATHWKTDWGRHIFGGWKKSSL
jgi:hypothetical protein